jgi:hypothetical protein
MSLKSFDPNESDESSLQMQPVDQVQRLHESDLMAKVAVAKRWPRNVETFYARLRAEVLKDKTVAESSYYKLKRWDAKERKFKFIEGPSIRVAEIALRHWGNTICQATISREYDGYIVARGEAFDFETVSGSSTEIFRNIMTSDKGANGDPVTPRRFSRDMIAMTINAALSLARRNALMGVVPRSLLDQVVAEAKQLVVGGGVPILERFQKSVETFGKMGVTEAQLLQYLDVDDRSKVTIDDIETLIGVRNSIRDKDTTVEEEFPAPKEPSKAPSFVGKPATTATEAKKTAEAPAPKAAEAAKIGDKTKADPAAANAPKEAEKTPNLTVVPPESQQAATAEPAASPAPSATTATPAPAAPAAGGANSVARNTLMGLMVKADVSADQVLAYCKTANPRLAGATVEDLWQLPDAKFRLLIAQWAEILPRIVEITV